MTDHDPLRDPRPMPLLPVAPGQVQHALALVRRRRRRTAVLTTTLTVAALTAVSAGLTLPAHRAAIHVAPTDGLGGDTGTEPTPASTQRPRSGERGAPRAPLAAAPAPTASTTPVGPPGVIVTTARPSPTTQPASSPRPGYRKRPSVRRMTQSSYVDPSGREARVNGGCVAANAWCSSVQATQSGPSTFELRLSVCRDTTARDSYLAFDSTAEIDISIRSKDTDREVWRWAAGQTFPPREHEVAVPAGACVVWTMTWDGVLDSGDDIPRGDYEVAGRIFAAETADERPRFPFTVR